MSNWTIANIPAQTGRLAVITGATGGLGYETALGLAHADATVLVTGRNEAKGRDAVQRIKAQYPAAKVEFAMLDLASLASVAAFAHRLAAQHPRLDVLINNAGVMSLPTRETTKDGFEMQFGTNYLGHYALTAQLLPLLRSAHKPRVVQVSSVTHLNAKLDFANLQGERNYGPLRAYGETKLAMLMFALELQRRSDAHGWGLISNAAHPGWARTDLMSNGPIQNRRNPLLHLGRFVVGLMSQSAAAGALPILFAATAPDAQGGAYYGPDGSGERKGSPAIAKIAPQALDTAVAARLWERSAELTGVHFEQASVTV